MAGSLAALARGFRSSYLDYATLTAQLRSWAEAYPAICRLHSLARTPEGREVWALTIGHNLDEVRPAVLVDGNLHAAELAGSSVALAIAEDLLRIHLEPADKVRPGSELGAGAPGASAG